MRLTPFAFVLSLSDVVAGHYIFSRISKNGGELSKLWQYVRNVTTGAANDAPCETCQMQMAPYYDVYDDNFRCGRGAANNGAGVETLPVEGGDEISFWSHYRDSINPIGHYGPGQAYLSKAPGDLETYTGDGDWFKIGAIVAKDDRHWATYLATSMNFTIPKATPPGKYLMRVEHSLLDVGWNETQWYVNCAHIEVTSNGVGDPGPMVKFPGAYDVFSPDYWAPYWVYGKVNLTKYIPPGPAVWSG